MGWFDFFKPVREGIEIFPQNEQPLGDAEIRAALNTIIKEYINNNKNGFSYGRDRSRIIYNSLQKSDIRTKIIPFDLRDNMFAIGRISRKFVQDAVVENTPPYHFSQDRDLATKLQPRIEALFAAAMKIFCDKNGNWREPFSFPDELNQLSVEGQPVDAKRFLAAAMVTHCISVLGDIMSQPENLKKMFPDFTAEQIAKIRENELYLFSEEPLLHHTMTNFQKIINSNVVTDLINMYTEVAPSTPEMTTATPQQLSKEIEVSKQNTYDDTDYIMMACIEMRESKTFDDITKSVAELLLDMLEEYNTPEKLTKELFATHVDKAIQIIALEKNVDESDLKRQFLDNFAKTDVGAELREFFPATSSLRLSR